MNPLVYFPADICHIIFAFCDQQSLVACLRVSKAMGAAALAEAYRRAPYDIRTHAGIKRLASEGNLLLLRKTRSPISLAGACENGDPELVRMALMMDPDFRAHDFGIMVACKFANYDLILHLARHITRKEHMSSFFERIIECAEIGSQRRSYSGLYAATACLNGDVEEMIKWFPEHRLQFRYLQLLSIYDPTGNSVAYFADRDPEFLSNYSCHIISLNYPRSMRLLLDRISHNYDPFSLRVACKLGRLEVVAEILKKGLFHHMLDPALHVACRRGHLDVVELLLAQRTPLLYDQCVLDIIAVDTRLPSHIPIVRCLLLADSARNIRAELYEELTRDTWSELSAVLREYLF